MQLTWKTVDGWREEVGMERSELARKAEIPERTIYRGLQKNSRLQASTKAVMRRIFPQKFEAGEGNDA